MSVRVSFWLLIGVIAFVGVGKAVQSDTLDWDLFWHLKVAEQLRAEGVGPVVDRLSFSSIKEPWTPYSWLAELGMKCSWDVIGWRVAVAGEAVLVAGVIAVMAQSCVARAGGDRRLNAVLATAAGALLTIPFISFRPITFAMLLLAAVAWLLTRERRIEKPSRAIWWIVPITAVLANVHLVAVLVPIWVGCLLLWERARRKQYAMLLATTVVACIATPMLPGMVRTALFYNSNDVMVASDVIVEMRPVYRSFNGLIALAIFIAIVVNAKKLARGELCWLCVAALLMLRLGKFTPMFAFVAAPMLAAALPPMNDRVLRKPIVAGVLGVALLSGLIRVLMSFPGSTMPMDEWLNRRGPAVGCYPTAAADFVEKNIARRTGRLINEFNWGGYLEWRLGDKYQTFLDGRTQLFPPEFWRATYLATTDDAARAIVAADADAAVIPVRKPRFGPALKQLGWRSVYRDDFAEVLLPPE